jgi:6-phosphogluconolactonase
VTEALSRPAPRIEVHVDAADLATSVAGELITPARGRPGPGEEPQIGLTGGSIAEAVHRELGRMGPGSEVDWSRVVVWWGDERFVAPDSEDRNAGSARAAFIDRLPFDPANVHDMPSRGDSGSADDAAAAYSAELREHGAGAFEVLMLGLGPDGHVASLFPGSPQLDVDDQVAVAITDSPKPPPERISLTLGALNRSRCVWFLVNGEDKAGAVAQALASGTDLHDIPAAGVSGEAETICSSTGLPRRSSSPPFPRVGLSAGLTNLESAHLQVWRGLSRRVCGCPSTAAWRKGALPQVLGHRWCAWRSTPGAAWPSSTTAFPFRATLPSPMYRRDRRASRATCSRSCAGSGSCVDRSRACTSCRSSETRSSSEPAPCDSSCPRTA